MPAKRPNTIEGVRRLILRYGIILPHCLLTSQYYSYITLNDAVSFRVWLRFLSRILILRV